MLPGTPPQSGPRRYFDRQFLPGAKLHLLALVLAPLLALTGCAARQQPVSAGQALPIWKHTGQEARSPGIIHLLPGEERTISVIGLGGDFEPRIRTVRPRRETGVVARAVHETSVRLRAPETSGGLTLVDVELASGSFVLPALVENHPLVTFSYTPPVGVATRSVGLAGSFNGWDQTANRLVRQRSGTFTARVPIPPGDHEYKFVVDGAWIADPSNPRRDESGYGNSLLTVEGDEGARVRFYPLGAGQVSGSSQGGLLLEAADGTTLNPANIILLSGNRPVPNGAYDFRPAEGILTFDFPASLWGARNEISILYRHEDSAADGASFPFVLTDAPRSPADEIIYSIVTDRFFDGDPSLNRPASHPELAEIANYHGGDWAGVLEKMEDGYFDRLGVTTLWISPVNKNTPKVETESIPPRRLFTSYHGYWPISATETNEQFGSMETLRTLIARAHSRGMAVLLDFVANHVHEDHPLMEEYADFTTPLILPDGTENIRRFNEHPYTTWFDTYLPSLDYAASPDLVDFMVENAAWWLRETGADGFRHDAVKHIPEDFWIQLTDRLRAEFLLGEGRRVYQLGETIDNPRTIRRYIGPEMMDGQFDFPLYFAIQSAIARRQGDLQQIARTIRSSQSVYLAQTINSPLAGNHDVPRFMAYADGILDAPGAMDAGEMAFLDPPTTRGEQGYSRLQLAFGLIFSLTGPPTVYYGDEIGMTGAADPDNRRFMQWDGWDEHQQETFELVSRLAHARRDSVALRRGALVLAGEGEEWLVIARVAPEETVLVFLGREPGDEPREMALPAFLSDARRLAPLVEHGCTVTLQGDTLHWAATANSAGYYRVEW